LTGLGSGGSEDSGASSSLAAPPAGCLRVVKVGTRTTPVDPRCVIVGFCSVRRYAFEGFRLYGQFGKPPAIRH
jgi:hypothetical protein